MANPLTPSIKEYVISNPHQFTYREVGEEFGLTEEQVRSIARCNPDIFNLFKKGGGIIGGDSSTGSLKGTDMQPTAHELAAFKKHCEDHKLPYSLWRGFWHKTSEFSSFFVNKEAIEEDKKNHELLLADIRRIAPKYRPFKYKKIKDPHLQLIDIADLHIGKYAIGRDGRVSYDMKIAVERAEQGVSTLLNRSQGFPTEVFVLPIGNDVVHVDNKNNTTTKGTRQDVTGMWFEMVRCSVAMYSRIIDELLRIAPVRVIYNPDNHGEHLAFNVATVLEAAFNNNKNVTFAVNPHRDREYIQYHMNMIGLDHGDGAKMTDLPMLMAAEEPKMWGGHNQSLHDSPPCTPLGKN